MSSARRLRLRPFHRTVRTPTRCRKPGRDSRRARCRSRRSHTRSSPAHRRPVRPETRRPPRAGHCAKQAEAAVRPGHRLPLPVPRSNASVRRGRRRLRPEETAGPPLPDLRPQRCPRPRQQEFRVQPAKRSTAQTTSGPARHRSNSQRRTQPTTARDEKARTKSRQCSRCLYEESPRGAQVSTRILRYPASMTPRDSMRASSRFSVWRDRPTMLGSSVCHTVIVLASAASPLSFCNWARRECGRAGGHTRLSLADLHR